MKSDTNREQIGRIKDARGRDVTQLDPFTLRLLRRHDVMPADALDAVAREIGSGLTKAPRVLFIIGLVCLFVCVFAIGAKCVEMLLAGSFSLIELARTASRMGGVWVGPVILWVGACRIRSQKTARVMLKHRRCPHCGYDLRGSITDSTDGATVCSECGCAWRVDTAVEPEKI